MRFGTLAALVCCSLVLVGCGGGAGKAKPTGSVTGKVTLNGTPLANGTVVFFAAKAGDTAAGVLKSDGSYSLMYMKGFSVPAGDYRVAVTPGTPDTTAPDPTDLMKAPEKYEVKPSDIPEKFRNPDTSGLIAVVKEGSNNNTNFDLK